MDLFSSGNNLFADGSVVSCAFYLFETLFSRTFNIGCFLDSVPSGIEIIVVDASSDDTLDIIGSREHGSLYVIRDTGNIAAARQIAAETAQTEWLLYSDADVVFDENYFKF